MGTELSGARVERREAARTARLHWVSDASPGITRARRGRGFVYRSVSGGGVTEAATLRRIRSLAIPPAWTKVWISPDPNSHIQATGRDARGRKQYRYHPRWIAARDADKFDHVIDFGGALAGLRRRVAQDLRRGGLPRERVVATVIRLLDIALIRVGNEGYAKENGSYGLTTLRARHVDIAGARIRFDFPGKSGKRVAVDIEDRRVARILSRCTTLPGEELFQYIDDRGERKTITSDDVNDYLRAATGEGFTAKDFRTWAGTVLTACELRACGPAASRAAARRNVTAAIKRVAQALGNTPAVCRRCYVHPDAIEAYGNGSLARMRIPARGAPAPEGGLSADERAVLRMLRRS